MYIPWFRVNIIKIFLMGFNKFFCNFKIYVNDLNLLMI